MNASILFLEMLINCINKHLGIKINTTKLGSL